MYIRKIDELYRFMDVRGIFFRNSIIPIRGDYPKTSKFLLVQYRLFTNQMA